MAHILISDKIINEYEVDSASAGNMVNNYNFIKEILVWVTITEDIKNKQFRVSVRSRGPEVNKVLENHGGGGHKFASGVRVEKKEEALKIVEELEDLLEKYNSEENKNGN